MQPNSNTESLERILISLRTDLATASDQADQLEDSDTSFDIGAELVDAKRAIGAAIDALDKLTAPVQGPRWDATIVHSPALDRAYQLADELFA
jgi:hypothetical protein